MAAVIIIADVKYLEGYIYPLYVVIASIPFRGSRICVRPGCACAQLMILFFVSKLLSGTIGTFGTQC